jgi:hypothetical protein
MFVHIKSIKELSGQKHEGRKTLPIRSNKDILLTFQPVTSLCKELPGLLLEPVHHHTIRVFNHPGHTAIYYSSFKEPNININAQHYYCIF